MAEAERRARAGDLFVVLGSSLVVYPAAYLPAHAQHAGATLVIVNLEATPLDARADLVIRDRTATTMAAVLAALHQRRPTARSERIVASDAELIAEFVAVRTEHRAHTPPSERQGATLSLAEAYRLQELLRQTLMGRGDRVTGWKAASPTTPRRRPTE